MKPQEKNEFEKQLKAATQEQKLWLPGVAAIKRSVNARLTMISRLP